MHNYQFNPVVLILDTSERLDHLGIFATQQKHPLLINQIDICTACEKFYPMIEKKYVPNHKLNFSELESEYDGVIHSSRWIDKKNYLLDNSKFEFCYLPHGNSDKDIGREGEYGLVIQDRMFVYGDQMYEILKEGGTLDYVSRIHFLGNYRYAFYTAHKTFFDSQFDAAFPKVAQSTKQAVLYAPTWDDDVNGSSFFQVGERVIKELKERFMVMIKLHPKLFGSKDGRALQLKKKYCNDPNVQFIDRYPPIYPVLNKTDIYLGDYSSVGYDFLTFDRPMYFIDSSRSTRSCQPLHSCGVLINPDKSISDQIENSLNENRIQYKNQRNNFYNFAFTHKKTPPL